MPELPEVETIRLQLKPQLIGYRVRAAGSHWSAKFSPASEAVGYVISGALRRGKYLIFSLLEEMHPLEEPPLNGPARGSGSSRAHSGSDPSRAHQREHRELIIHLGMTGRLAVDHELRRDHPHLRAWWTLDNEAILTFHDVRRFGLVRVVRAGCYESIATLNRLGPEPFSSQFTGDSLWRALQASRRRVKTQLLSQRPVAGIGNIYADEALWLAGINPVARRLSKPRAARLASAIREALESGLRHGGTTLRDYATAEGQPGRNQDHLHCYGRAGQPCGRCGAQLRRRVIDARGTTWCPVCQRH